MQGLKRLVLRLRASISPRLRTDVAHWREVDQEFELAFHRGNELRRSDRFAEETRIFFGSFGFSENQFRGRLILDIGAGSRLRTTFFKGAAIAVIEPLAERFMAELEWSDLRLAKAVYSVPAEEFVPELENVADFVVSVNALDHCFDFPRVAANISRYLRSGGCAFLSFDERLWPTEGHSLILTERATKFSEHKGLR